MYCSQNMCRTGGFGRARRVRFWFCHAPDPWPVGAALSACSAVTRTRTGDPPHRPVPAPAPHQSSTSPPAVAGPPGQPAAAPATIALTEPRHAAPSRIPRVYRDPRAPAPGLSPPRTSPQMLAAHTAPVGCGHAREQARWRDHPEGCFTGARSPGPRGAAGSNPDTQPPPPPDAPKFSNMPFSKLRFLGEIVAPQVPKNFYQVHGTE